MDATALARHLRTSAEAATSPQHKADALAAAEALESARDGERHEAEECSRIAQVEGDRLLGLGDDKGSQAAWKIAALIRQRVEQLNPF